jgi:hypothetical protein
MRYRQAGYFESLIDGPPFYIDVQAHGFKLEVLAVDNVNFDDIFAEVKLIVECIIVEEDHVPEFCG